MNAVAAMEDLCFTGPRTAHIQSDWSLPQYDLQIHMNSDGDPRYQFAAWGLQVMTAISVQSGGWPVVADFLWDGIQKGDGRIDYGLSGDQIGAVAPLNASLRVLDLDTDTANATARTPLQDRHTLEIRPAYGRASMTASRVFRTALATMLKGAERGIDRQLSEYSTEYFEIFSRFDRGTRQPLLRWRQVVTAMRLLTRWMVARDRFAEISFELYRDGGLIAVGALKNEGLSAER